MLYVMTFLLLCAVVLPGDARAEVKLGVLANRGAPECMKQWGATAAYLSTKIGDKVTIVPLKFEAVEPAIAGGQVDLVLANSAFYVELEKTQGVKASNSPKPKKAGIARKRCSPNSRASRSCSAS